MPLENKLPDPKAKRWAHKPESPEHHTTAKLGFQIIATNSKGWGVGPNMQSARVALMQATRNIPTKFYIIPSGATVVNMFTITYPEDATFTITEL